MYLFLYSISENDDVHDYPKKLACGATTHGIWSKLVDDRTIVQALTSYKQVFAVGLGEGKNKDFTAWSEPYKFITNGVMGVIQFLTGLWIHPC